MFSYLSSFFSGEKSDERTNNSNMFSFGGTMAYKKQPTVRKKAYNHLYKIIVVGDSGVGKSCSIMRFAEHKFYSDRYVSTIGADFKTRTIDFNGTVLTLQLWDTAGQERFQSIGRAYYRGADGVMFFYDTTNQRTFDNIELWKNEFLQHQPNAVMMLIGSKCDLKERKQVSNRSAKQYADQNEMSFFEISSKDNIQVEDAFFELTRIMHNKTMSEDLNVQTYASLNRNPQFSLSDSDDEQFSDGELEEDLDNLVSAPLESKKEKSDTSAKKHSRTNVNICKLTMASLEEEQEPLTGDPVFCRHCGVLLNYFSVLSNHPPTNYKAGGIELIPAPPIHPSLEEFAYASEMRCEDAKYWKCEFCMKVNRVDIEEEEIPKSPCVEYIAVPEPVVHECEEYSNIVFCMDISGSMCVTSELNSKVDLRGLRKREEKQRAIRQSQEENIGDQYLPNQRKDVSFVSRLQCLQSAVDHQIHRYQRENPEYRVGLITFGSDVTLIGDGSQQEQIIAGDRLYEWDEIQEIANSFTINSSVSESTEVLLEKLWELEESGATALGPALQASIVIAGAKPGSRVILCTDGLANVGLGSLEGKETEYTPYYTELAEQAILKGVTVSVVSLIGSECSLENLSIVTDQSGGSITRVDPLQLEGELSTLNDKPILGYTTVAMIVLHKGLRFQNEMDDENENRNWIVKDLGNVRSDTELSFQYCFRSKEECDLNGVDEIPFQVQLMYTKPNGAQCLRIAGAMINVTDDRSQAEKNANLNVIGTHAAQRAAKYAKGGDYERAQMETRSAQRFMKRNGAAQENISKWSKQVNSVDSALRSEKKKTAQPVLDETIASVERQKKGSFSFF